MKFKISRFEYSANRMYGKYRKKFAVGSFTYHTAILMSGTLIAQLLGFAALTILTRIYTVAQFGEYAMYLAVAGFGTVIATGRYEMAIMLPRQYEDSVSLVVLSVLISTCLSIISFFIILTSHFICTQLQYWHALPGWSFFIPLTILLTGIYQSLSYWLTRNKQFAALSQAKVAQAIATALVSIFFGYNHDSGSMGLIYGVIFGQVVAVLFFSRIVKHRCTLAIRGVSRNLIWLNANRYKEFPVINTMHVAIDTIQSSVLPIAVGMAFGKVSLGYYAFATRVIGIPIRLISSTAAQIFFQRASEKFSSKKSICPLILNLQTYLAVTVVPFFLIFMVVAPFLFEYLFGIKWVTAGKVARILSPWLCISVFISTMSQLPVILGKQKEALLLSIKEKLVLIGSLAIGLVFKFEFFTTFIVLSFFMSIYAIYLLIWMKRIAIKADMKNIVGNEIV